MTTPTDRRSRWCVIPGLAAAAFGVCLCLPSLGRACSCLSSPGENLAAATEIFSGRVTAVKDPYAAAVFRSSLDPLNVTFAVERVWKGAVGPTATVSTASDGASCGFRFTKNERYLIYAHDSYVSACGGTNSLAAASADIAALGPGYAPATSSKEPGTEMATAPEASSGIEADADDVREYDACPDGTATVVERLGGFLDSARLLTDTYDRACDDCMLTRCEYQPRQGPFVSYYPDSRVHMRGFYNNGKRQGAWRSWYPSGKPLSEGAWRLDRKWGVWKVWFENGTLEAEIEYTDDRPDGRWKWWRENGHPSLEGAYSRGQRIGIWRAWDEDGNLIAEGQGGPDPTPSPQ